MNKLTHEQFNKMWEDITKEEVLFQFYYNYYEKVEALDRIDKVIEYIENDMPYLEEPDEEFERCDGTTYITMKEYDKSVLLNILRGEDNE